MLRGIGDRVQEEEGDIEGVSLDSYRTPPDFVPASDFSPPPFVGKTTKRRKTREAFYNGYGVVYLPGDIKGLTDQLHLLSTEFFVDKKTQSGTSWLMCWMHC